MKILKSSVESFEEKISKQENYEIKEIIETQKLKDEVIAANLDAIRRIDKEVKEIMDHRREASTQSDDKDHVESAKDQEQRNQVKRKK